MNRLAKNQSLLCLWVALFAAAAAGCGGEGSKPPVRGGGAGGSISGGAGGATTSGGAGGSGAPGGSGGRGGSGGAAGYGGVGPQDGGLVEATPDVAPTDTVVEAGGETPGGDLAGGCSDSKACPEGKQCNPATRACDNCASDAACKADPSYGAQFVCLAGSCVRGDCHDSSLECVAGQVCGVARAHTCGPCTADAQCTGDARYGAGFVCQADGKCAKGDCSSSSNCTGAKEGLLCGATVPNTCGSCGQDSQCKNDPRYQANQSLCFTAAGPENGRCVANTCPTNGVRCAANLADFCCAGKCVPGNCCDGDDTPCKAMGATFTCVKNTCTACEAVTGNQYFVDPERGNDLSATGSGRAAAVASSACMFRTITRVLEVLPQVPAAGTTITIVGNAGRVTELLVGAPPGPAIPVERLPIDLPANVKVTTKDGAIRLKLPAGKSGFHMLRSGSSLAPDPGALLSIEGASASGSGLFFAPGAAGTGAISNVTIENAGSDGVQVQSGTLAMGAGVRVIKSGTATLRQNGLDISGGTVQIVVPMGSTPTVFEGNFGNGIAVGSQAELDITGSPLGAPAEGKGTVVVSANGIAGINLAQDPAFAARRTNDITGVVSFSNEAAGLRVLGGSRVKLRGSVLLANGGSGVLVEPSSLTGAGNDLSAIDLGSTGDPGRNVLQTLLGMNPNNGAGLCVDLDVGRGALTLRARGNTFAGVGAALDCAANPAPTTPIVRATTCGRANLGVVPKAGTTITIELNGCTAQ